MRKKIIQIDPFLAGVMMSALLVALLGHMSAIVWPHVQLTAEFLRALAGIGASLFLAFVIEATWLASRFDMDRRSERLLAFVTGIALWGFFGVGMLMYLSESHAGQPLPGDENRAFWYSISALGLLGFSVAFQPVITHAWLHGRGKGSSD